MHMYNYTVGDTTNANAGLDGTSLIPLSLDVSQLPTCVNPKPATITRSKIKTFTVCVVGKFGKLVYGNDLVNF